MFRENLCLALVIGVSAISMAQTSAAPESFPEIVANVNGVEIKKADLLRRAEALKAQLPPAEMGADFYQRVLDDMVGGELLSQSVDAKGLAPTDAEVDLELASQTEKFGGPEAFQSALESQGITVDQVRLELKKEIGIQKLVERDFVPQLSVSEEEKRRFYDENAAEMQRPMQFRVAHILIGVEDDATEEQKQEARQKAVSLRSLIDAGQDFAELARRNSDDPGSSQSGGELPWMSKGQTVPPFEAAVTALQPGELSDVVETQYGYHIIRLLERREAGAIPYEDVQERIDEFLKRRQLQDKLREEVDSLRTAGKVEVFI
jgi:peptidyl-prolyl cis-trans isomerase C